MWWRGLLKSVVDKTIKTTTNMPNPRLLSSSKHQHNDESNAHSTINAAEIELFSKKTKEWWDPKGPMKMLHKMNMIRVPFIRDGLVQCKLNERELLPLRNKKILDVGCGGGILSEALARLGAEVTGVDASKELIAIAEDHKNIDPKIAEYKPTYYVTSIEEHVNAYSNFYDGVVASEVIEHVNNPELFVKSCVEAVKPGGKIFFTTPNRTPLSRFLVIGVAENILKYAPRGTHQFEKFITPTELTFILERSNCHVELLYGYIINPLTNNWSFTSFQQLGYALQAVKLQ